MKGIMFKEESLKAIVEGRKTQTRRAVKNPDVSSNPLYNPMEIIYIKEPYTILSSDFADMYNVHQASNGDYIGYQYFGGKDIAFNSQRFTPKMFMPAKYARHFIEITDVGVQRVQEIGHEDIFNEGFRRSDYNANNPTGYDLDALERDWITLWNSINKPPYSWEDNPWVWVYEFKLKTN